MEVKKALMPTIQANKTRAEAQDAYTHAEAHEQQPDDFLSVLVDAREYDVPYYVRCSIDLDIRYIYIYICVCICDANACVHCVLYVPKCRAPPSSGGWRF